MFNRYSYNIAFLYIVQGDFIPVFDETFCEILQLTGETMSGSNFTTVDFVVSGNVQGKRFTFVGIKQTKKASN